jgi:hypothetical protein
MCVDRKNRRIQLYTLVYLLYVLALWLAKEIGALIFGVPPDCTPLGERHPEGDRIETIGKSTRQRKKY